MNHPNQDELLLAQLHHIYEQEEENRTYGVIRIQQALEYHDGVFAGKRRLQPMMNE